MKTSDRLLLVIVMTIQPALIVIDLNKQQALDGDPKAIQQINFTRNIDCSAGAATFFIIEEIKETILDFLQGTRK